MQNEMRERLIELVKKVPYGISVGATFEQHFCEKVADHLLENGVTVQKWISVKDRLPEETQGFLVVLNNEDFDLRVFNSKNEPWQTYSYMLDKFLFLDDKGELHTTNRVTHWMPLPTAPNEDEQ